VVTEAQMSNQSRPCTGCEQPTTDFIVIAGQRLPYHPACAADAERDLRAILPGIADALAAAFRPTARCRGRMRSSRLAPCGPFSAYQGDASTKRDAGPKESADD